MILSLSLFGTALVTRIVPAAFAMTMREAIHLVAPTLPSGGGNNFGDILKSVAISFSPIVVWAAALAMTFSGFFLALSGNENQATTARRVFISSLTGIALLSVIPIFASNLRTILASPTAAGSNIAAEVLGLVTFLEVPLGILCVIMIIISGVRAIANFGSEDGVAQLRRTVLFIVAGFILVSTRSLLGLGVASGNPASITNVILTTLNRIISLTFIIAVGMIVYAGILMIVNIGREEQYSKAKGLILRVGIGLVIMIASGGIVRLLTSIVR